MLGTMFGGIGSGRLGRLAFLGALVLLILFAALAGLVIVVWAGIAVSSLDGDIERSGAALHAAIGLPALLAVGLLYLLITFGYFNVIAKRVRDTGLPGWAVVIGWLVLMWFLRRSGPGGVAEVLGVLALLYLLLMPGRSR